MSEAKRASLDEDEHTNRDESKPAKWKTDIMATSTAKLKLYYIILYYSTQFAWRLLRSAQMTLNVEYNQLDPLLRSNGGADENDPTTNFSLFPGNINQLVMSLPEYVANLEKTGGVMGEFVNAKYTDSTKTAFKKPTRLEVSERKRASLVKKEFERLIHY